VTTEPDAGGDVGEDVPGEARVCVVATRAETFEACREGVYPAPHSYERTTARFEYMAFYRTAPTSAITHYAPVTARFEERRARDGRMTAALWETLVDPFSDTDRVVVFELGELVPLADPIVNDAGGVRGAWYCTIGDLRAAATVSELADRLPDD
jgi:hypothetical protein